MIPQATAPAGYSFNDVQLEMSLKPFWDNTPETREAVCREIFQQWGPLCRWSDSISVMLWIGDGSEILEYEGDLDFEFEWARYHGSANDIHAKPVPDTGDAGHTAINGHVLGRDPDRRGVHLRSYLYRPEPAKFSFRWLRDLVETLKRMGHEITGKRILVGETFDIGPEFAVSRFKYDWHREICGGGALFGGKFIRCDVTLEGDIRKYAGYPTGIPQGTTVGAFVGRQTRHFFADMGFDFLWLSNGFGFALEPWALTGAIFDGETFRHEAAEGTAKEILRFWRELREELPHVPIRTRGTNLATGIDLASDASPIREIFRDVPHVDAPVNSPWAALDGDVGLELAGWMSHIARLPHPGYRYRYYIHDAWWLNSPWLDRYQRHPFDIYLPLSVSRLKADATVEPPSDLAFLSIDDSHGCMPPQVPVEVTSHILHAREFQPDAAAPLVWVYPFDAYHELAAQQPAFPFFGDWFVRGLITHTVPVNTVSDSVELLEILDKKPAALGNTILLAPVLPDSFGLNARLLAFAEGGGQVLFYGPLAEAASLSTVLGLSLAEPLNGDFAVEGEGLIRHLPFLSAGGWAETGEALVSGTREEATRAACSLKELPSGGKIGWVRGSLATSEYDLEKRNKVLGPRLNELPGDQFLATEKLARLLLSRMGVGLEVRKSHPNDDDPMLCVHRHRNAYVFSGYQPASTSELSLRFPLGAPLFIGEQNRVANGTTTYCGSTAWHHVCRFFVEQEEASLVECRIVPPIQHGYSLRLLLTGLKNATVHFLPEPGIEEKIEALREPMFPYFCGEFVKPSIRRDATGVVMTVEHINGEILFSW
ncbi:hypothetical protein BH09VER1_BH09VER1_12850 [soil metagenome]